MLRQAIRPLIMRTGKRVRRARWEAPRGGVTRTRTHRVLAMSIIGVGIDVAEIDRFAASLERTPGLARRLFLDSELLLPSGHRRG